MIPLSIRFGDDEYIDGVTITREQFYAKLMESDVTPCTSQATPDQFTTVFREAVDVNDEVVAITLSQKLSGTYQSACIAAEEFSGKVFVVDSETATVGAGILAELALSLAESGEMSAADIATELTKERENIHLVALLDTLEYLKRGGRISKTVAFVGGLLSVKPVISLAAGELKLLGKARGSKQGNNLLVKEIENAGGVDFTKPVLLGYSGISAELLQKYIEDSASLWQNNIPDLDISNVGSVIGTHVGPGAIAAAFFKKS